MSTPAGTAARPNVVVLLLDTARADAFEPYGAPVGSTPAVAQLAARGSAVRSAYAPANWTVPSHAALFSGLLPRALGLTQVPGGDRRQVKPLLDRLGDRWLPEALQQAGYSTRAVSANPWISPQSGFGRGFDSFDLAVAQRRATMHDGSLRARLHWGWETVQARLDDGAAQAAAVVDGWLAERTPDRPFFWFVNLLECHSPYLPPKPWNDLGLAERWRAGADARRFLTLPGVLRVSCGGGTIPEPALRRMRHLYAGSIRSMDAWIARLLQRLDEHGVLDDTQVVVTSDHGENLGEQALIGHALSLDERLIRVPFVTAGPLDLAADEMFTLGDVPLWLAKGLGLPAAVFQPDRVADLVVDGVPAVPDGIAVAQHDALGASDHPAVVSAQQDWNLSAESVARLTTDLTAAGDGRWKLVRSGEQERWFDLQADPLEESVLTADAVPDELLPRLRAAAAAAATQPGPDAPLVQPDAATAVDEDAALEEQMRLLGYL